MVFICAICRTDEDKGEVLCPVTLGHGSGFELIECRICRTRQLYPLPTDAELARFYSTDYYGSDWFKQRGFGLVFARWHLPRRPNASFLDVGASLGHFLDGIRSASNWEVLGTEFGAESVEYARSQLGIDVRQGELMDIDFGQMKFDFIRINNVLEHVRDPRSLLERCRELIKDDGTLHLTVPNGRTDSQALLNFYASEMVPPRSKDGHIFFFPKDSLLRLIKMAGFSVDSAKTLGLRRGLRTLGYYPQKKNWKQPFYVNDSELVPPTQVVLAPEKKRPELYYHMCRLLLSARMLPGFQNFGLDFSVFLKPVK